MSPTEYRKLTIIEFETFMRVFLEMNEVAE